MTKRPESLGQLLLKNGVLRERDIDDILEHQRNLMPFGSAAYNLGYVDEHVLAETLSRQNGLPAIIFDESTINLNSVRLLEPELAIQHNILPFFEDNKRIFVAVDAPSEIQWVIRELEFLGGKILIPHLALKITLARAVRESLRAIAQGEKWLMGRHSSHHHQDHLVIVGAPDSSGHQDDPEVPEEVTSSLRAEEILGIVDATSDDHAVAATDRHLPFSAVETGVTTIRSSNEPKRIMIVDDDFASRHLLVKVLQPEGYVTITASTGGEAIRHLKQEVPDAVIMDVMLPELDGFQVCRAIKKSKRYRHIPVVLMSAVIDRGRVTKEVLKKYGADAYLQKPLRIEDALTTVGELLKNGKAPLPDQKRTKNFGEAMELYKKGNLDAAIILLRKGLADEPLSAKHHFVLANLLQKKELLYEAIDAYEATVELRPDYFPALTRLAYLYYQKGFSLKAIETWRRSLPYCEDSEMRQNIENFMRKLITEMGSSL